MEPMIYCHGLVKIYKVANLEVVALQGLELTVEPGELVAIVGASGSGKSTLMNILGGLDVPSAGRAVVAGHALGEMRSQELTEYRRRVIGFVRQQTSRNLLPYLNVRENVELPMVLDGLDGKRRRQRLDETLALMNLADHAEQRPQQLSGGQQQRVAIAVALANRPSVLLADEPTGELDTTTASEVFGVLRTATEQLGVTILVVTHDPLVNTQVPRTVAIRDGRTSTETLRWQSDSAEHAGQLVEEEYAVLDRVGRLQLPRAAVEALNMERRVRVVLETDHISIWPDRREGDGE